MAKYDVCPYFGGCVNDKNARMIKCGENFYFSFTSEANRNAHMANICKGNMESCRPFLYRRLEELGLSPRSGYWSNERLASSYKAINEAVSFCDNNIFRYLESVLK